MSLAIAGLYRCLATVRIALLTLPSRWAASFVAIISLASIAGVLLSVLALAAGVSSLLIRTGADDVAIVLSRGAFAEIGSMVPNAIVDALAQAPGLRGEARQAIAPEYVASIELPRRAGGFPGSVVARGLPLEMLDLHAKASVAEGRMFRAGLDEVVVGRNLSRIFQNVGLGDSIAIGERRFRVVGTLASDGDIHESEIWGDASQLRDAFGAPDHITAVYARLRDARAYAQFASYVDRLPAGLTVQREADFYAVQGERYRQLILWPGISIVSVMALAGLFAVVNTIQSSVNIRLGEIGTLRALGFQGLHIVLSILAEAGVLGLCGAVLGAVLASAALNDAQIAGSNGLNFVPFRLNVTAATIVTTVAFTTIVAVVAGVLPAVAVARKKIVDTLYTY